ncbi:MAG TPA: transcriptional regulator [Blastocatellia bacterium]|nr:transcriptional regulator [Blastocatellia bacterium]
MSVAVKIDEKKYRRLLARALPTAIKTEQEYERILAEVEKLISKPEEKLSAEELALLELLSILIEQYEDVHYPIPDAPPNEVLKLLMEEHDLQRKDLMPIFRSSGILSEVLSGKRGISKAQAKALGKRFHLPADVFI